MANTNLQTQYKNLEKTLASSPTAFSSGTPPSKADIANQKKLMAIGQRMSAQESKDVTKNWYGPATATEGEGDNTKKGYLDRFLKVLSAGVTVPVGAIEALTGKGTKKGLVENMAANFEEGEGYGDLLRKFGVNSKVAGITGFGLDVALDPINWLTAGTAAFVPKIAKGAIEAGVEGAKLGLTAGALQKAKTLAKPIKWFGGVKTYGKIAEKAAETGAAYDKVIGRDVAKMIEEGGWAGSKLSALGSELENSETGRKIKEMFWYSPRDWYKKQKAIEDLVASKENILKGNPDELKDLVTQKIASTMSGEDAAAFLKEVEKNNFNVKDLALKKMRSAINDGADLALEKPYLGVVHNTDDALHSFADEYLNDLALKQSAANLESVGISRDEALEILRGRKAVGSNLTGVKFYDDLMKKAEDFKIGNTEVGKKILNAYRTFIDLFKIQKIGTPSTVAYSVFGNGIMAGMAGLDFASKKFYNAIKEGYQLARGKPSLQSLSDLLSNTSVKEYAEKYPKVFQQVFGISPRLIFGNDSISRAVEEYSKLNNLALSAEKKFQIQENMAKLYNEGLLQKYGKEGLAAETSPFTQARAAAKAVDTPVAIGDTSYISSELNKSSVGKFIDNLKKISENPGKLVEEVKDGKKVVSVKRYSDAERVAAKALHWYLTKPIGAFEKVDQSFKLGNFLYLVRDGISEQEMLKMSKWGNFKVGRDVFLGSDGLWRFSPDAGAEVANEIYMNYAAMPGAVKVLRTLPFLGSPFFAFTYAMLAKTGKTAIDNPAFFNKVNFALKELSGGKSPLEKQALESKYYDWYKKNGMVSLPWFGDNPLYVNLASFIPYYTMNIFQPSDRNYARNFKGELAKVVDSLPFLKTPEGQVFADYFLMPQLMQETNPSGQFGQPLFPTNAPKWERYTLYPLRSLVEAQTSPILGAPLGLGAALASEKTIPYLPNYRARQIGYAALGKTSVGKPSTSESAVSRTARAILSTYAGLNLYPMKLQFNR